MQSRSVFEQHGSASVERGVWIHQGQRFEALGSVVDTARGLVVGYPKEADGGPSYFTLRTWNGAQICPLVCVRRARLTHIAGRYVGPIVMYYWRATIDGVRYSGRNQGTGLVLRLRAGKRVAS